MTWSRQSMDRLSECVARVCGCLPGWCACRSVNDACSMEHAACKVVLGRAWAGAKECAVNDSKQKRGTCSTATASWPALLCLLVSPMCSSVALPCCVLRTQLGRHYTMSHRPYDGWTFSPLRASPTPQHPAATTGLWDMPCWQWLPTSTGTRCRCPALPSTSE